MNIKKIFLILIIFALASSFCIFLWLMAGYLHARVPVTQLPEIELQDTALSEIPVKSDLYRINSIWYTLKAYPSGRIAVMTPDNSLILSGLAYFSSHDGYDDNWGLHNTSVTLENDSTISIWGAGSPGTLVNMIIRAYRTIPILDIKITTEYTSESIVNREALAFKFDVPVSEVYKKNRKVDTGDDVKSEYWLQKQGVKFGDGPRSALIYNSQGVSSLQLNTDKSLLFVNLDYNLDHPFINIPFQADGGKRWNDLSSSKYSKGSVRTDSVSLYFGHVPDFLPRLMLVPKGYLAGHVFTEHADGGGTMEPHLAAYLGSDSIIDINKARGGFVGHKIPVTKSVMFSDSYGMLSDSTIGEGTVWNRMKFFLDKLYETGLYDICLHTPEDLNSNRQVLEEAIAFMKDRYDTRSWIDHGMYDGTINRECFVCDGLNPESDYYAADLWEKHDTRYFWSSAVELIRNKDRLSTSDQLKNLKLRSASEALWKNHISPDRLNSVSLAQAFRELFKNLLTNEEELNSLFPGRGDNFPTPLYWRHPTYAQGFYSWVTDYVKDYRNLNSADSDNQLEIEKNHIDLLIGNWGIFIGHGYYVRGRDVISEQNGHLAINPQFDRLLAYLKENQNKGDLYNTTIKDLLDYWTLTENISFIYQPDGTVKLSNNNEVPINGLSMAVTAEKVVINGTAPLTRRYKDDLIFWFDMPEKTSVIIRFE